MAMKSPWILAGVAVLLGAAGCRDRGAPEQTQPVAQAQQQSEQALERAEDAQEEALDRRESAIDAREELAQARQELHEARQELREAQQQAQQQIQEALEAQRRAEQQAQIAQQQAQQARDQLAQRQGQQAQVGTGAQAGTGAQTGSMLTVNGRVAATQEDALLLRSPAGESVRLLINEDTQILINGEQREITDIPAGVEVRASYRPMGEQEPTALRIEVMNQAMGGSGAQQGSEQKY